MTTNTTLQEGHIVGIAGPVIDVEFPPDSLPDINFALEFEITIEGRTTVITAEVAQQIGESRIRAIAMKPTDGLTRGAIVRNLGRGIQVPVGDAILMQPPEHARGGLRKIAHGDAEQGALQLGEIHSFHQAEPLAPGGAVGIDQFHFEKVHLRHQAANGFQGVVSDYFPVVDDHDAIAEPLRLFHVVRGVNQSLALAAEFLQAGEDGVAALGVHPHGWLVEEQNLRLMQEGGGQVETPLHAAAEGPHAIFGAIGEAGQIHGGCHGVL